MSEKINDGGPAFPTYWYDRDSTGEMVVREQADGMSLRDYFAAKAMQSIIAKSPYEINSYEESKNKIEVCAIGSYVYADAMLKAREL